MKQWFIAFFLILFVGVDVIAHPMPHSILSLYPRKQFINAEYLIPLSELQLAIPFDITSESENQIVKHKKDLVDYIHNHLVLSGKSGKWHTEIVNISLSEGEQVASGTYRELLVKMKLIPPNENNFHQFILYDDCVIHQVVTHKIFVNTINYWENDEISSSQKNIGIIELDIANNTIQPLSINLENAGMWKGFKSMVKLGMHHIAEGIDHLFFLFTLLLITPLVSQNRKWIAYNNLISSLKSILKITISFTIGHSLTLVLATFHFIILPSRMVEILIAISIMITAIHALKPLFANKEVWVALGFGLVHGLAFSNILKDLNLNISYTVISLLGFNIGLK